MRRRTLWWIIAILSAIIILIAQSARAQIGSVLSGCPPGTQVCDKLIGGFGNVLDMEDAESSEPCPGGTSDPAGACDLGMCFFQGTTGVVWWCTPSGWAPGGNSSSGGRFIHVHKAGGAQTMTTGNSVNGWTLQERSSIDDFTVASTAITIKKEGVYLINGGVNAEVDGDDPDCMTFATTVDSQTSSSSAAKADTATNEFFFQSVFSMVTDISVVPATVTVVATECTAGSSVSVKSGSSWMNISIVSAVAAGSALDTGPKPDCANDTDIYQDGQGNCDTVGGDVSGPLDVLVVADDSHGHIELNISDLTHTTNTNAGTICGSGLFLNGDTTCDAVSTGSHTVDTGPIPDCSGSLTYQDGNGGCDPYTLAGSTAELGTISGAKTSGDCTEFDASGNIIASGAACGASGSVSFTNLTTGSNTAGGLMSCGTGCAIFAVDTGTIVATEAAELSTDPSACGAGDFVNDVDADGTLTCDTPAGGSAPSFDAITNGDNSTATAMVVSGIATLSPSGTGTITANRTACAGATELMGGSTGAPACYAETLYPRLLGRAGGQDLHGGTAASEDLTLESTFDATKGTINIVDAGAFGANLDGDTFAASVSFYTFLDGIDFDANGTTNTIVLDIGGTVHVGQASSFLQTHTALYNGTVFELDDASNAQLLAPWTFQNSATYKRSVNQTYSIITQSYRDTPTYENAHSTAWATAAQSHQGFVAGTKIKTSSTGDITMSAVENFISYPLFSCASGTTCTETLHIDYKGLDTETASGAGTEVIDNRYTFWVERDTTATNHYGLYTEVPIQLEPDQESALSAGFTLTPDTGYLEVAAGGARTSSVTTAITSGVDGQLLTVANTDTGSDIITIKDGANTQMDGDFAMNPGDTISFIYDLTKTDWLETSRADNDSSDAGGGGGGSTVTSAQTAITGTGDACSVASIPETTLTTVATLGDYDNTGNSTLLTGTACFTFGATRTITFTMEIEATTVATTVTTMTSGESTCMTISYLDTTSASAQTVTIRGSGSAGSGAPTHSVDGCFLTRITHD